MPVLQRFVTLYAKLGGRVVAGTDTAQQFVVPGASLHRELELYVAGGLTPAQALKSATSDAADLLGIAGRAGTIQPGKDADLVLVSGDPLADIRATRRILNVVRGGVVVRVSYVTDGRCHEYTLGICKDGICSAHLTESVTVARH